MLINYKRSGFEYQPSIYMGIAMKIKTTLLIATGLSFAISACSPAGMDEQAKAEQNVEYLNSVYDDYFEADLRLNPIQGTFLGRKEFNDQLVNTFTEEYRQRRQLLEEEYLAALHAVDSTQLPESERLSYRIFERDRQMALEAMQFPDHLIPINQFYNAANRMAQLGSGQSAQPFETVTDYENWASRMAMIPQIMDQAIENMREGADQNVVQPAILMQRVLTQLRAHLPENTEDSLFYAPIQDFPDEFSEADQDRLEATYRALIEDSVLPAYKRLHDYIENEYLQYARTDSYGLGQLPGGEAWYDYMVRMRTTTDMSADEIHQVGLDEVARIHHEIEAIMAETGFEGDLAEFFEFTRDDPQFHYSSREEMLEDYRDFAAMAEEASAALFHEDMLPRAGYEVRKVERFREQSASSGSYSSPSTDGSRPGIFYLNTYDLPARPTWAKAALTLHEAVPGHHYQIALQREMEHLPPFRRFGGETAFIEGWGLYAESLGDELGVYGPYDRYGKLVAELWRSIRLVVDTGIHAKGWSRQQVLDYMYENAPVQEARAVSEAERYMALPGQALAYKIGQLKIQELRDRAESTLGDAFDVRDFHREVLRHGSLPLSILEQQIDQWIARETSAL